MSEKVETPNEINNTYTGEKREEVCKKYGNTYIFENGKCDYIPCEHLSIHVCDNPILKNRCNVILDSNNVPKCMSNNKKYSYRQSIALKFLLMIIYCIIISYIYSRHNKILNKSITGNNIYDLGLIFLFCILSWFIL